MEAVSARESEESLRTAAARAETGVPLRTDLVRTCPVVVEDLEVVFRDGEGASDAATPSEADTRPTPPEGGFLDTADISLGGEAVICGMQRKDKCVVKE